MDFPLGNSYSLITDLEDNIAPGPFSDARVKGIPTLLDPVKLNPNPPETFTSRVLGVPLPAHSEPTHSLVLTLFGYKVHGYQKSRGRPSYGEDREASMVKVIGPIILALAATLATARVNPSTDEKAMYGNEGPLNQNWLSREVSGWPAPYLADNPDVSVIHKVGFEDSFRFGPFVATLSFWFLVINAVNTLLHRLIYARRRK